MRRFYAIFTVFFVIAFAIAFPCLAEKAKEKVCVAEDRACVLQEIESTAATIDDKRWRDQTYRELAKTYAFEGDLESALSVVPKIETPDTRAMSIRGIGMAVAGRNPSQEEYESAFTLLRAEAEKIKHPPSYAIALTYIAMAQAFAKDNEGAWKTAADMKNDALRHKAYAETAEIQAEFGDFDAAMISISKIDSAAFRNKAYAIIAKIFADRGLHNESLKAAMEISNAYKKAKAMQYLLDKQKPRDVERKGVRTP